MKNLKIKVLPICIVASSLLAMAITACKNDQPKEKSVVDQMVEQSKAKEMERKNAKDTPKELNLGKTMLSYTSQYAFVKNENKSQQIKAVNPQIVDAGFYDQNISNLKGNIALTYSNYSVKPNLEDGINGQIEGYKKMPGVEIGSVNKKDVSNQFGYPAIMTSGKFKLSKNGETFDGNFHNLSIVKGNEAFNFQAFTDLPEKAKEIEEVYNSISLK
ncbi:MAG TPA: hypothetical protein PLV43_03560 [Aequorivita sp.]|nr:hypothetical protein [Aequorivita sp.]